MSGFAFQPVQTPDFGATLARSQQFGMNQLVGLAQLRQMDQEQNLENSLLRYGAAAGRGDPEAIAAIIQSGPAGARLAMPMLQRQQERAMAERIATGGAGGLAPAATPASAPAGGASGGAAIPANLMPFYEEASKETGVPIPILAAMHRHESSFNPTLRGNSGEIGIGQVLPSTAAAPGYGVAPVDPAQLTDPRTNILFSARYLAGKAGQGDWNNPEFVNRALAAYNGGGDPNYVAKVRRYLDGGAAPTSGPPSTDFSQVDALRRRAQAAAIYGGDTGKILAEQLNQQANALERRIEADRVRQDNPPPTVQLGDGPWGKAGVYERLRGGGYRRVSDNPPPSTVINQQPESVRAAADRETLKQVMEGANQARQVLALLDRASAAAARAPAGWGAQFAPILGQVAKTVGIDIRGTSEAEVLQGLTSQLATLQRMPGSGATSDFEMGLYMRAVPQLSQTPEGRQKLIELGRALARRKIEEANIWRRHAGAEDLMDRLDALPRLFNDEQVKILEGVVAGPGPSGDVPGPGGVGTAAPPPNMPPPPSGFRVIR